MLIYHASYMRVERPDTHHSRQNLDFGKGFYATVMQSQAERYAQRFILRNRKGILNVYEYKPTADLQIKNLRLIMQNGLISWLLAVWEKMYIKSMMW